jgi:hypothetical protein
MNLNKRPATFIQHKETKVCFHVISGAPSEWAKERGATHTLLSDRGGTRPAILSSTVVRVGIDEDAEGNIVWERWPVLVKDEEVECNREAVIKWYKENWKSSGFKHLENLQSWEPLD